MEIIKKSFFILYITHIFYLMIFINFNKKIISIILINSGRANN